MSSAQACSEWLPVQLQACWPCCAVQSCLMQWPGWGTRSKRLRACQSRPSKAPWYRLRRALLSLSAAQVTIRQPGAWQRQAACGLICAESGGTPSRGILLHAGCCLAMMCSRSGVARTRQVCGPTCRPVPPVCQCMRHVFCRLDYKLLVCTTCRDCMSAELPKSP